MKFKVVSSQSKKEFEKLCGFYSNSGWMLQGFSTLNEMNRVMYSALFSKPSTAMLEAAMGSMEAKAMN